MDVNALIQGLISVQIFFFSIVNNGLAYSDFPPLCAVERYTTAGHDSAKQERGFWYCLDQEPFEVSEKLVHMSSHIGKAFL